MNLVVVLQLCAPDTDLGTPAGVRALLKLYVSDPAASSVSYWHGVTFTQRKDGHQLLYYVDNTRQDSACEVMPASKSKFRYQFVAVIFNSFPRFKF